MSDDDVVATVRRACVDAGEPDPFDEAADLALQDHGLAGAALVCEDDGFALVRDGDLVLAVAPTARRRGVGRALLRRVAADADRAWSHADHPAAARLAASAGWRRTRELWVMRRTASTPLPELEVPPGVGIRGYRDGDEDDLLRVNAAAFAHHPEQGSLDHAGFEQRRAEPWWDPAGLLLAVADDGALLAFHWTKQHDARAGEVYVVGVDPAAQGRGLGHVVTLAGLHHLAGLGVAEVVLYVESDNTPAVRTYDRLGFTHAATDTHVQYRR